MPITHAIVKAPGQILNAVADWNANHLTPSINISGAAGNTLIVDTDVLVVDATNDRVGIRTVTPSSALDVHGTTTANPQAVIPAITLDGIQYFTGTLSPTEQGIALLNYLTSAAAGGKQMMMVDANHPSDATNPGIRFIMGAQTQAIIQASIPSTAAIADLQLGNTNQLWLDKGGNVGIKTASPARDLTVKGIGLFSAIDGSDITNIGDGSVELQSLSPSLFFVDSSEAAGSRLFRLQNNAGVLAFKSQNDAGTVNVVNNILVMEHATGNVGIGTATPAVSALLDLTSTTGALLVTRMTTVQKTALTAINGMIVYDATLNKFQGYEAGAWANLI